MKIQINTDHNIEAHAPLLARLSSAIEAALERFREHITRVEVHLSDESAARRGPHDQRCMIEARLEGRQPIAVTCEAMSLDQAVEDASHRLVRLIGDVVGRTRDKARHAGKAGSESPID